VRVFVVKAFGRFAKAERLTDEALWSAVVDAEAGRSANDLGGGLWKVRIPRSGSGRSSGYRTLTALTLGTRAVFLHAFAKNELDNIGGAFLTDLKAQARIFLAFTKEQVEAALQGGAWREILTPRSGQEGHQDGDQ